MQRLLGQALHPSKRLHSGRIVVSLARSGHTGGPAGVHIAGAFQALGAGQLPRFDIDASVLRGSSTTELGATSTGDRLFVRLAGVSYLAPSALMTELRQSYAQGAAAGGSGALSTLGVDPGRWLTRPTRVGTATLDGVRTVHIRAGLDAPRFTADLRRLQAQASGLGVLGGLAPASPTAAITEGRADVYVGAADHLLRELSVRAGGRAPLTVVLTFGQLNQPQVIQAPARARPLSSLLAAISAKR